MEKNRVNVEEFISAIRDSFVGSQQVYTEGSCWHFYNILKCVFKNAEPYYDGEHVTTKIDGKFYDITGEVAVNNGMSPFAVNAGYWLKSPYNIYKPVK